MQRVSHGRSQGEELQTPSWTSSQSSPCPHCGMCYGVPKQTWKREYFFFFWLKGVLVDSLTSSYMFCTGEWKVMQIPPETLVPVLNLQHMRANATWQLRFSWSLQCFHGEENPETVSAAGTELRWVPLSLAATFFTLCCNMKREFALPFDVYLNFTCVHNSQEKMTNWENICFHKSQETVAAGSQTNTV